MPRKPKPYPSEYAKRMIDAWGKDKAYRLALEQSQTVKSANDRDWWRQVFSSIQPPPPPPPPPPQIDKACQVLERYGIKFKRYGDTLVF